MYNDREKKSTFGYLGVAKIATGLVVEIGANQL